MNEYELEPGLPCYQSGSEQLAQNYPVSALQGRTDEGTNAL